MICPNFTPPSQRSKAGTRLVALMTLASLAISTFPGAAWAQETEQPLELKRLKERIPVELKTPLSIGETHAGDAFETVVTENIMVDDKELPAGTTLRGQVTRVSPSKNFGRPGYVRLDVEEAVFPNGETVRLEGYAKKEQTLHHPKGRTVFQLVRGAVPFTAVSVADSIPLTYATSLHSGIIVAISLGARMTVGAIWELCKKDNRSAPHKVGYGMFRGTGIPGGYQFVTKSPAPDFQPGQTIGMPMDDKQAKDLFAFSVGTDPEFPEVDELPPTAVTTPAVVE